MRLGKTFNRIQPQISHTALNTSVGALKRHIAKVLVLRSSLSRGLVLPPPCGF